MSPVKTTLNVGAYFDERDRVNARLVRRLAELRRLDVIDAIYGQDTPALLCGSAPRLKAVA